MRRKEPSLADLAEQIDGLKTSTPPAMRRLRRWWWIVAAVATLSHWVHWAIERQLLHAR